MNTCSHSLKGYHKILSDNVTIGAASLRYINRSEITVLVFVMNQSPIRYVSFLNCYGGDKA